MTPYPASSYSTRASARQAPRIPPGDRPVKEASRRRAQAGGLGIGALLLAVLAGCSPSAQQPAGPAGEYASAKQEFAKGETASYDRALNSLEALGDAKPANEYTTRARMLRAVILAGKVEADIRLADAYGKGAAVTKDAQLKAAYSRLRDDTLQRGGELALDFGQLAMDLTKGGALPKDLSLDASYPSPPPPGTIAAIQKMDQGLEVGQSDQLEASRDAQRSAMAGVLDDLVHGNSNTAPPKLSAGPVPVSAADFALFLTKELAADASLFDKKHLDDPSRYKLIAGVADGAAQAAAAALKENPDPGAKKDLIKLQDQIKKGMKAI